MRPEDFDLFSTLVRQRSGLVLESDKAYLLESRLFPVTRKHNLKTLEDVAQILRSKRDESLMFDITDAMTTNETHFFCDRKSFAYFRNVILPQLLAVRAETKHIRIWSAATSSGQEAYSIAMICTEETAKLKGWKIEIIGTDISRTMIARAKAGTYTQFEVQRGLPIAYLIKYFQQLVGDKWQIKDTIRQCVQFREGNLLSDFGLAGSFDMILCRNVLGYFDAPTRQRILAALANTLSQDGYLLTGYHEAVAGIDEKFKEVAGAKGLYRPIDSSPGVSF